MKIHVKDEEVYGKTLITSIGEVRVDADGMIEIEEREGWILVSQIPTMFEIVEEEGIAEEEVAEPKKARGRPKSEIKRTPIQR